MHIKETKEEMERLQMLREDKDERIAFLAEYIFKIIRAVDHEEEYLMEQRERG